MGDIWKRKQEKQVLEFKTTGDVPYLAFPILEKTGLVCHGFSTRLGGVSSGVYATMNFAFLKGDDPDHVRENYRRMAKAIGVDVDKMVLSWQTHTTNIHKVTKEDAGKGIIRERDYKEIDGLITNEPGMTLVTFYADCVPLYLLDPVHRAIGLSHSGWRGTVNRMGLVTVETMNREYGSKAEDIIACIGPSICQDCYEVGEEVAEEFKRAFSKEYWPELLTKKTGEKYMLNLWKANEIVLLEAGIRPDHIETTDICTHCNPDYLFSHRTMGSERGNLAAFLCLKE